MRRLHTLKIVSSSHAPKKRRVPDVTAEVEPQKKSLVEKEEPEMVRLPVA